MTTETVKASDLPKIEEDQGLLCICSIRKLIIINHRFLYLGMQIFPHGQNCLKRFLTFSNSIENAALELAGWLRSADFILTKKPSCFLARAHSCQEMPVNPLRRKGFEVFHSPNHVICSPLISGRFNLFVGRFVGNFL